MAEEEEEEERDRVSKVIPLLEKATNSTDPQVDPRLLKAIKTLVKYSDSELRLAAKTLLTLMKRPHSQIRYLAILIIDELFMRSKLFRTLISENLDQLLSLSVGFRRTQPLPAPNSVATVLRSKTIEFLEKWNASFGIHYRQLRIGYDYLKNTLRFKFPNLQANAARIQQERRERELRTKEILRNKFESLRESLPSLRMEIQSTVDEIGECIEILRGYSEDGVELGPLDEDEDDVFEEIRNHELRQIRIDSLKEAEKVHENSENKVVFDMLRELYKLLVTKHLVSVQQWISVLIRVEADDTRFRDSTLKEFIDFRNLILAAKKRSEESGCSLPNTTGTEENNIWEEGKIEPMEENTEDLTAKSTVVPDKDPSQCSDDRSVKKRAISNSKKVRVDDSDPLRSKLLAEAPLWNWGSSLDNWGDTRDILANQRGLELDNHWGRVDCDAAIPAERIAELNVHATIYKEEQTEIQPCRAPLSKGGLCHRRDLKICPFHGSVIPRDDEGTPIYVSHSPPVEDAINLEGKSISMEELAKQAVKNVRERDKGVVERAVKRAKRAKMREHNDAVLRDAAMASTSTSSAYGEIGSSKNKKPTLASMLQKKVTRKDRLAQRLLGTRVRDATIKQLTREDDNKYRESFPNQW